MIPSLLAGIVRTDDLTGRILVRYTLWGDVRLDHLGCIVRFSCETLARKTVTWKT
jgi:hypothetical protein